MSWVFVPDGDGGKFKSDSDRTTDCLERNGNYAGKSTRIWFSSCCWQPDTSLKKGPDGRGGMVGEGRVGKQSLSEASCPLLASQNYCYSLVCLVGHILGACQIDGPKLLISPEKLRGINSGCACDFKADFTMLGICAVIRHSALKGRLLPYSFYPFIGLKERLLCKFKKEINSVLVMSISVQNE